MQLVDCIDLKLGNKEGVVEGWEPESGRVTVRVAGERVKVWLSEIVAMGIGPEEQIAGERKRRTMSEPNSAALRCGKTESSGRD